MSAVLERERRASAGKRMTSLVGKAAEEDAAFWGHETWKEDDASGNESFHESDEDSELKRDQFDSDFNDSESDHEQEEQEAGDEEERQLARDERKQRSKRTFDVSRAGRELLQKRKGKAKKRVVGHGVNAGIVLNVPGGAPSLLPQQQQQSLLASAPSGKRKNDVASSLTVAATRPRRTNQLSKYSSRFRVARTDATKDDATLKRKPVATTKTKKRRKRFSQEELLLEAANETEPDNERWLLARKRVQDQNEKDKESTFGREIRGKVIEQLTSRRGTLNTVTFPEMDHVPAIFIQSKRAAPPLSPPICVITGKLARYRDPRTMTGYYDATAFRELRRRYEAGEPVDQRNMNAEQMKAASNVAASNRKAPPKVDKTLTKPPPTTNNSSGITNDTATKAVASNVQNRKTQSNSSVPSSKPVGGTTKDTKPPAATSPDKSKLLTDNDIAKAAIPPQLTRRDSAVSNESSHSRRSSPRKRKPSAKLLRSMELERTASSIPSSIVAAAVPTNGSHTASTATHESEESRPATELLEAKCNSDEQSKPPNGDAITNKKLVVNPP